MLGQSWKSLKIISGSMKAIIKCLKGSEEFVIGTWRKGKPCSVVSVSLDVMSPADIWKIETICNKLNDATKEM